jgi:L-serine deaminase
MRAFFTDLNVVLVSVAVAFILGVLFSQKIKDWAKGIPTDVRTSLTSVETAVRAKLAASHATTLAPVKVAAGVKPAVNEVIAAVVDAHAAAGATGPA